MDMSWHVILSLVISLTYLLSGIVHCHLWLPKGSKRCSKSSGADLSVPCRLCRIHQGENHHRGRVSGYFVDGLPSKPNKNDDGTIFPDLHHEGRTCHLTWSSLAGATASRGAPKKTARWCSYNVVFLRRNLNWHVFWNPPEFLVVHVMTCEACGGDVYFFMDVYFYLWWNVGHNSSSATGTWRSFPKVLWTWSSIGRTLNSSSATGRKRDGISAGDSLGRSQVEALVGGGRANHRIERRMMLSKITWIIHMGHMGVNGL